MSHTETILWFDFETFGSLSRPWDRGRSGPYRRRDRPSQFGAIRTDLDLQPVGDPIEIRCTPPIDEPPSIGACLVTGIGPQDTIEDGVAEHVFFKQVLEVLSTPGSICTGWNSLGYDDDIIRFGAWRNLLPTYDREWKHGNRRFDLLAAFRMAWSTGRHDGIEWPTYEDGSLSLRLGELATANGISEHAASAHDALGDVRATIEMARKLRESNGRLWDHAISMGIKDKVKKIVGDGDKNKELKPFFMSVPGLGAARGHGTVGVVVASDGRNERVVIDLHGDPAEILKLEPRQVHARFHGISEDGERLSVRRLRVNSVPMVAPAEVLTRNPQALAAAGLDELTISDRMEFVRENRAAITERIRLVMDDRPADDDGQVDAEEQLYGRFVGDGDGVAMARARTGGPEELRRFIRTTSDERLEELAFRFLARVHPESLDSEEQARWDLHRRDRLTGPGGDGSPRAIESLQAIEAARAGGAADARMLQDVEAWTRGMAESVGLDLPPSV
jgi:exodeoxyribonuclease-1